MIFPPPGQCPTCNRPLSQTHRFVDDGLVVVSVFCDGCGYAEPVMLKPARCLIPEACGAELLTPFGRQCEPCADRGDAA